jgi:hypothetical protein
MGMKVKCRFCGRYFDEEDLKIELGMGPLCECINPLIRGVDSKAMLHNHRIIN